MKINWKYLKRPPVIIGGIVLFFIILFVVNHSKSSSSAVVTSGGPDPNAVLGAQTQLAEMQIQAGVASQAAQLDYAKTQLGADTTLALAQVSAALSTQQLAAQKSIADETLAMQSHQADLAYQQSINNNSFAIDYAKQAYDYSLATTAIGATLQQFLATQQLKAFEFSTVSGLIAQFGNPARRQQLINTALPGYAG